MDIVESVIGIAKNLFFNSPMEACIIICRMNKSAEHRGKVLFINAKEEVTRKNAQSYLEEEHIAKIADAYLNYKTIDGFSQVATSAQIAENGYSLGIPLYISGTPIELESTSIEEFEECITDWLQSSASMHDRLILLDELLDCEGGVENA